MKILSGSLIPFALPLAFAACSSGGGTHADTDTGTDTDTDVDADADADGGSDAGADTDTDADTDTGYADCSYPFEPVDRETVLPPAGATVTLDYSPVTVAFTTPFARPECPTDIGLDVWIYADSTSLSPLVWLFTGTVPQGEQVTATLDLSGMADGEVVTVRREMYLGGSDFSGYGMCVQTEFTFGGPGDPVEVTSCVVRAANVGADLDIRCHGLAPGGMASLADGWGLTGGPVGAEIADGEITDPDHEMAVGDVAWHDFTVTASDGISTSAPFDFSVPVDLHLAYLSFYVLLGQDASINYRALLPEGAADEISFACAPGFDAANKPASAADEAYIVSVEGTCAQDAIAALPAVESTALFNYPIWADDLLMEESLGQYLEMGGSWWNGTEIEYRSAVD
jgi:hypothetical protein